MMKTLFKNILISSGEYYLDLVQMTDGIYIYQIYTNDIKIGQGKLVVQK